MRNLILTVGFDLDANCPMDADGSWTLVSFNQRSVHYGNPDLYLTDGRDGLKVRSIGLRSKLSAGTAFWLEYHEHGNSRYSITTDVGRADGVLLWPLTVR